MTRDAERYDCHVGGTGHEGIDEFPVVDPSSGGTVARVAEGGAPAVEAAIRAARDALPAWRATDPAKRGRLLRDVADRLRAELDALAARETDETGRPLSQSRAIVSGVPDYFDYYAGLADKIEGETIPVPGERLDYTVREPVGVTGHVVPWNAALKLGVRSIAPALAAGNTVVAKPAPEAPLSLLEFARVVSEAGLPDGVLNVVPGDGERTGEPLVNHPGVDSLTFTGSRATGRRVMQAAAEHVVPVGLELGGKSPSVVFPDADLDDAVAGTMRVFANAGQVCFATTRVFVHEDVYARFVERAVDAAAGLTVGSGAEDDVGPLISEDARDAVHGFVEDAVAGGARLLTGGTIPDREGFFYPPTILDEVDDDAPVACEEVFGPVLTLHPFAEEREVVRRANDTRYGLYAAVWTTDLGRAHRVARDLQAGGVTVNDYPATFPQAPFGGYKESGIGREKGRQAIDHYTQLKNVTVSLE